MERDIVNRILKAIGNGPRRLFRNNTAQGWAGKSFMIQSDGLVMLSRGDVVVKQGYPIRAGLCKGSSDLIGWQTVMVTPEMIGSEIAVFTAIEVKTGTGVTTKEQRNFIDVVRRSGGFAGVARNAEQAESICTAGRVRPSADRLGG